MTSEVQNVDGVKPGDDETTVETTEKKVDVNELASQLEQIKKAQAGSDKAYSLAAEKLKALEAENDKLKKSSMDAEERAAFERDQADKALTEREAAVNKATLRLSLIEGLGAAEMGNEWGDFIPGSDQEEVLQNIGKLKELIDKEVGKRVNSTLNSTTKPKFGESVKGDANVKIENLSLVQLEKLAREGKLKL
jgi:hypothetical protein